MAVGALSGARLGDSGWLYQDLSFYSFSQIAAQVAKLSPLFDCSMSRILLAFAPSLAMNLWAVVDLDCTCLWDV